jgi:hypothetical protein
MASAPQSLDSRFPPNIPIPGRGLPGSASGRIPTPPLRLAGGLGLFVASLAAAALLTLGPAVVIATLSGRAPVVVALMIEVPHAAIAADATGEAPGSGAALRQPRSGWRSQTLALIAVLPRTTRGRLDRAGVRARGGPAPPGGERARLSSRADRLGPGATGVLSPARRPRPPPAPGGEIAYRLDALNVPAPAALPYPRRCAPAFLSSRV